MAGKAAVRCRCPGGARDRVRALSCVTGVLPIEPSPLGPSEDCKTARSTFVCESLLKWSRPQWRIWRASRNPLRYVSRDGGTFGRGELQCCERLSKSAGDSIRDRKLRSRELPSCAEACELIRIRQTSACAT